MAFKFTSSECYTASSQLSNSSAKIGELLETFGNLINSVANNYQSDASREIVEAFNKVKSNGPAFQQAIADCANYLNNEVAPAYEKLEQTAKSKISA